MRVRTHCLFTMIIFGQGCKGQGKIHDICGVRFGSEIVGLQPNQRCMGFFFIDWRFVVCVICEMVRNFMVLLRGFFFICLAENEA
jgi:hypothetical protein